MYLGSFQWRLCSDSDLRFHGPQVFAGQIKVVKLVLLIAQSEDQIPVSVLNSRDDVDGAQAEIRVGLFQTLFLDSNLPPVIVDRTIALKWLSNRKLHV